MNTASTDLSERVLIVGRSPIVLVDAVDLLRAKGYLADATNQFDSVLEDYDVTDLDVLVFGGMVPPATKHHLRDEITQRNPRVRFVQGLAGIAGVIAAQVEALLSSDLATGNDIGYDDVTRTVHITLEQPAHVTVEAWWGTSFTPPEPTSTSMIIWDNHVDTGTHNIPMPDRVPSVASFAAVTTGSTVRVFTVGDMPDAVKGMVPTKTDDQRLPDVRRVTTTDDR